MKEKSLSNNFLFNFVKTLSSMIFPILTFTYSARILGVEGIGKINFSKAVITYFIQIATLGMNYYGTREASKRRNSKNELSKFVQEMLIINGVTTVLSYMLLFGTILAVPKFQDYRVLLFINSFSILLQGLGMEWFFQALEEYQYIAIRSIIFQIITLIMMFIIVRTEDDLFLYALLSVVASSGSYIINFLHIKKYISFQKFIVYDIKKHLKPILWLFAMEVSIELYTVMDTTMLGIIQGDLAVGKYTAAIKINKLFTRLITSLGIVLIPRLSYYVELHEDRRIKDLVKRMYNFVFLLSVPVSVGLCVLSNEIVLLFSGNKFISAGFTMKLLAPIIILIPFSMVTNNQTFIPMGKEKLIVFSTCAGALTNFCCNLYLIPRYAENGAAIATVLAELMVAIICFMNSKKYFDMKLIFKKYYQYWIAAFPIIFVALFIKSQNLHYVIQMGLIIFFAGLIYFMILSFFHNVYFLDLLKIGKKKISKMLSIVKL